MFVIKLEIKTEMLPIEAIPNENSLVEITDALQII